MAMTKKNKSKSQSQPLNLDNCERLLELQAAPINRSDSPAPIRTFDDLQSFETFVRDETWDNEFDKYHAHLSYYPPFILKECHEDLEKIKPTMNKNSSKFKRHLKSHIQKHLMHDLETVAGYPMQFDKGEVSETFNSYKMKFVDESLHGFDEESARRHWKIEMEVKCNNENPMVEVDLKSIPLD